MTDRSKAKFRRWLRTALALTACLGLGAISAAQWGSRGRFLPPKFPDPDVFVDGSFSFCRVLYEQQRWEDLGHGWNTDYPDSDVNLMIRLDQLTRLQIRRDRIGAPDHVVVRLTDDELFDHPFIFMSDVGTVGFDRQEAQKLHWYLLSGGFLWVDDFWGELAWYNWVQEIGEVLPLDQYPIVDIPLDHPIFAMFFTVREVPQIPSIQHWYRSGGGTSERGLETERPHLRGIFDESGRLMVLMSHNTDIADGWEREADSREFFERFSLTKAYPLGINVVLYSVTH